MCDGGALANGTELATGCHRSPRTKELQSQGEPDSAAAWARLWCMQAQATIIMVIMAEVLG